jgi:hypothetical protein
MEHVKHLVQSIRANDGLHDPIIVKGLTVLEGNSRLAAYRMLSENDPVKWGFIKAKVLPDDTSESLVFALLGEYHLIGKKDWAPYEQAGYLYRRNLIHKIPIDQISVESGLSKKKVRHLIKVFKYMVDHNQNDVDKWSYYDEYLKGRDIGKMREEYPELDDAIIKKINIGEISRAADLRDKLKLIAKSNVKNKKKFVCGERDFETAYNSASEQGFGYDCFKKLNTFRLYICDLDTEKALVEQVENIQKKCLFEIKKIHHRLDKLHKRLS